MRSVTYLSLSFLLLVSSLAGGFTDKTGSFSSGSASVSGGAKAFSSTGGSTSTSVRTRTSVSSSGGRPKTATTTTTTGTGDTTSADYKKKKKRAGGRGKKRTTTETVELGEGSSVSITSAKGTGSVYASSSSSVSPGRSKGTASTTVGGKTRTVTKVSGGEEGDTIKRTSTKATGARKGTGFKTFQHYPICRGIAQFKCCDDRVFHTIDGDVYCGCWGDQPKKDFCSFLRLNSNPLVVQDVFGALSGDICVCGESRVTTNEIIDGCRGTIKRECCDDYGGSKNCRCDGDTCEYTRVSNKPLMWKSRTSNRACVCY